MLRFYESTVKTVHLEPTTKCNAACPMCARNMNGGADNPHLPLVDLSLDDVKKIFQENFIKNLEKMYMCGNYGDPIVSNYTLSIFEYFNKVNPNMSLAMHTNGSARDKNWWRSLAEIFGKNHKRYVVFGIDGVDTNFIYRRRTNIEKILENAEAFIKAGGNAQWHFIVFKHNEHEIEKARNLATKMNFKNFVLKKTGRFFSNAKMHVKQYHEVWDQNQNVEYVIEPPTDPTLMNPVLKNESYIIEKYGSMHNYLAKTTINCKVLADKSVYVDAEGHVFPCCWLGNQKYVWWQLPKSNETWKLINECGGIHALDGRIGIENVINSEFFHKVKSLWSTEKKLIVCGRQCGTEFDTFAKSFARNQ